MRKLKLVQVGIGTMGDTWLNVILESPEFELTGFVEINEEVIREQSERYNLKGESNFSTLEEAIDNGSPDGIIIVTPPEFHKEMSLLAIQSGIPVLCEKPLAGDFDSAREIVDKANETGVLHMVAQNYRYKAPIQTIKNVLDSGELGQIGTLSINFYKGPILTGFHQDLDYPLLIDMSIHHFDLLRYFFGSVPEIIEASSWNPPWSWHNGDACASVTFSFPSNIRVTYSGSWCSTGMDTSWIGDWRFDCEKGVLLLRNDKVFVQKIMPEADIQDGTFQYVRLESKQVPILNMERENQAYLLHEFYQAISGGKQPVTTCQDNIRSVQLVWDVIEKIKSNVE